MTRYLPVFTDPEGEAAALTAYHSALHHWPVPYEELMVPTGFGETHVVASGPRGAPVVILLHALFAGAVSWYRNIGALSAHYRVYAVDAIGEPNPSRPSQAITDLEQLTQWFAELTAGLGVRHFDLIGSSSGGFAGAYIAMRLPERVRKLVLIGPAATFHRAVPYDLLLLLPRAAFAAAPQLPGLEPVMRRSCAWMLAGLPADEIWGRFFHLALVHGALTTTVWPRVFKPEELRHLKAPTMLLIGDHERIYGARPGRVAHAARAALPGARIEQIPQAHHLAALANPAYVNQRILWFLDSYDTRPDGARMHMAEPTLLELAVM